MDRKKPENPAKKAFRFGNFEVFPNVYLSPMAGVTDLAFRRLLRSLAGGRVGLMVSEFVSTEAIRNTRTHELKGLRFDADERPFCVQLFGGDPARFAEAVRIVSDLGIDAVEINAGCPAPKMVRKGGGSQLLKDLPRLARLVAEARRACPLPLSLKVRTGWDESRPTLDECVRIACGEGLDLLVVHGRTRAQGYAGAADWGAIARAKRLATELRPEMPVVGNGDVRTVEEAVMRLETSGVDGVSSGRGAIHNPWLLAQIADAWEGGAPRVPSPEEQRALFADYERFLEEDGFTPSGRLGRLKLVAARLMKAVPGGASARADLLHAADPETFRALLDDFFGKLAEKGTAGFEPGGLDDLNG